MESQLNEKRGVAVKSGVGVSERTAPFQGARLGSTPRPRTKRELGLEVGCRLDNQQGREMAEAGVQFAQLPPVAVQIGQHSDTAHVKKEETG